MKLFRYSQLAAALLFLSAGIAVLAQESGYWYPSSQSAADVTGPVELKANRITIEFVKIPMVQVRALTPDEALAVFDVESAVAGSGALYHLKVPAATTFVSKNTLCGHDDTGWMATWASGKVLKISFFSGEKAPVLNFVALNNSAERCGTYTYVR
jgi:hypothetical protein